MLNWIKLEPGCKMPDYDEFVLWRDESGLFFVREIDKDDSDWWNGKEHPDAFQSYPRCTHYARIPHPDEELSREAEKYFNDEQGALWDDAINIICEHLGEELPSPSSIEDCKKRYIISRK